MALFVHLAPAKAVARIRRAGIKRGRWGVFCMPVLADYYTTHQWARELKRRGHRRMLAISFWLDDADLVEVGRFSTPHQTMRASEAVKALMEAEDRQGYEVIVPHAISPRDLRAVRPVPHVIGWRFYPEPHGRPTFCLCNWCSRGEIKRRRNRRYQERRQRRQQRRLGVAGGS